MAQVAIGGLKLAEGVGPLFVVNLRTTDGEWAGSFTEQADALEQMARWSREHPEPSAKIALYSSELAE